MDNMIIDVEFREIPTDTREYHRQEREQSWTERERNRQVLQLFLSSLRFFAWAVTLATVVHLVS